MPAGSSRAARVALERLLLAIAEARAERQLLA